MNKRVPPIGKADGTTFENLAERVKNVHDATSSVAKGAVNQLLTIRNWAIGCYIDLDAKDAFSESELEQAIMDHLQEFLLEMGKGFCFEARQKRIIIDDEYLRKKGRKWSSMY